MDSELEINSNYSFIRCNSHSAHTGGVAIYFRRGVNILDCYSEIFLHNNTWFLTAQVTGCVKKGIYSVLYHSPSSSDSDFINIFESICEKSLSTNQDIVW